MPTVIDTNVWATAAGCHADATPTDVATCSNRLGEFEKGGVLAVDNEFIILGEYYQNLPVQSAACKILNRMRQVAGKVEYQQVVRDDDGYAVVPPCLTSLDKSDRVFAAVALTYDPPAPIRYAIEKHWERCCQALRDLQLDVRCWLGTDDEERETHDVVASADPRRHKLPTAGTHERKHK